MRQFLDRSEWQYHIEEHFGELGAAKLLTCPHPRTQCILAFLFMQDLKFHLQDAHCVEIRKGRKRSSPENEAGPRPRKIRVSGDAQRLDPDLQATASVKQEYKFVDEAAKVFAPVTSRRSTTSSTTSKTSTPSLCYSPEPSESGSETLPLSTCSADLEKIDPRLLEEVNSSPLRSSTYDTIEIVDLTALDEEMAHSFDRTDFHQGESTTQSASSMKHIAQVSFTPTTLEDPPSSDLHNCGIYQPNRCKDHIVGAPKTEKQYPEPPSSSSLQAIHEEKVDAELDDDQYFVERLLRKRVRRIKKRKVVQYLVKWKGYPEEENTWVNDMDVHEDIIKEYENTSFSAP